jgi:hypothetical protein
MSVPEFNGYRMNLCHGIGSATEVELPAVQPARKAAVLQICREQVFVAGLKRE